MKDWGTNIVRLGVIWEAVERRPLVYDQDYLNEIETLIDRLAQKGIYTIVDSHQDMFSRRICGEGVPTFYFPDWDSLDHECPWSLGGLSSWLMGFCKPFEEWNIPVDSETGYPIPEECGKRSFIRLYAAPEVASVFE